MRHYGSVYPQFWTGRTGRAIRDMARANDLGKDVQRIALYLMTSPHANFIGLYWLPTTYLCEEVGMDKANAAAALEELRRLDFCFYDQESEHIWVKEMARFQIGSQLSEKDGKVPAINRMYQSLPDNPWLGPFFDRYTEALHLTTRRGGDPGGDPPRGAIEAPNPVLSCPVPVLSGPAPAHPQETQPGDNPPGKSAKLDHATPTWIIDQWNTIPGVVPFEGMLQGEIEKRIKARLRERTTKAWWLDYFGKVREIDWLCGRNEEGWAATLSWAMGPVNIGKVLAGHYANRRKPAPGTNGAATPEKGCNADPAVPCGLPVVSAVGSERRCPWHSHLARNPELNEDYETFARYWPTVHQAIRKNLSAAEAWKKASGGRLLAVNE